jgi:hypothetical protein
MVEGFSLPSPKISSFWRARESRNGTKKIPGTGVPAGTKAAPDSAMGIGVERKGEHVYLMRVRLKEIEAHRTDYVGGKSTVSKGSLA